MPISLGNTSISSLKLGTADISAAYLGNNQVFSSGATFLDPGLGTDFTLTSTDSEQLVSSSCSLITNDSIQPSHPDRGQRNYGLCWQQSNGVFAARYNRELLYQNPVQVFPDSNYTNLFFFSTGKRKSGDPHKRTLTTPQRAASRPSRTGAVFGNGYNNGNNFSPVTNNTMYGHALELSSLRHIEYIKSGSNTLIARYSTVGNNNTWYGISATQSVTGSDYALNTEFFNTTQWGSNYSFLYTVSENAADKDVLITYQSVTGFQIVKNVFGYPEINTSLEKKGRILSAAINSNNLNIVGFFNTATKDLDIKIFSVNYNQNPIINFNPGTYRINLAGEKNIRFNDAGRANFCFISSVDETTNQTYIRRVTATNLTNLALSPRKTIPTTGNAEELVLTSWSEHLMGLYKVGTNLRMISYGF
jgi:hypothetical protein